MTSADVSPTKGGGGTPRTTGPRAGRDRWRAVAVVVAMLLLAAAAAWYFGGREREDASLRSSERRGDEPPSASGRMENMDELAREYVRLVLALGVHDADAVDAYYGPADLQAAVKAAAAPIDEVSRDVERLRERLDAMPMPDDAEAGWRVRMLRAQVRALAMRTAMRAGRRVTFDEESAVLYDAVAPTHGAPHFEGLLSALDRALPGTGSVSERYERFRTAFVIPPARVDAVFRAAVDACRSRTRAHVSLPAGEEFTLEYVEDKPWSGYNWYQGNYRSVIQVNMDLPIFIDRALDLACHEGYPGHHVYNVLLEQELVRRRGWIEWSVYPLFSPQSLIAEGTANFGIAVAFPAEERVAFERDVLFPLAGLDRSLAARYHEVQELAARLAYAGNEAARRYIDGTATAEEAVAWLERFALMSRERAEQRVRFFDRYRSYVINYNLGEDLVEAFVDAHGGVAAQPSRRWEVFADLLRQPRLPSELARHTP